MKASGSPFQITLPADKAITCGLSDTDLDYRANFSRHNDVPLAFWPGTQWAYSFSTDILGAIIAGLHGNTLEDAVVAHIAGPLGMADTRFHVTDADTSRLRSTSPNRNVQLPISATIPALSATIPAGTALPPTDSASGV